MCCNRCDSSVEATKKKVNNKPEFTYLVILCSFQMLAFRNISLLLLTIHHLLAKAYAVSRKRSYMFEGRY